jgi:hypothetical protein
MEFSFFFVSTQLLFSLGSGSLGTSLGLFLFSLRHLGFVLRHIPLYVSDFSFILKLLPTIRFVVLEPHKYIITYICYHIRSRDTVYPQTFALASPTNAGRSVGTIRSRTKATELLSSH